MLHRAALTGLLFALAWPAWPQASPDADQCSNLQAPPDEVVRSCTSAIESGKLTDAQLSQTLTNRGLGYWRKGAYIRAIEDYDEAIRRNPQNVDAFNGRGAAYTGKGDSARAVQDYTEAIRLNPNDSQGFYNRGLALAIAQEFDRAIQDYNEAIRLQPSAYYVFSARAVTYSRMGDHDHAIQDYTEAIRLNPKYANAFKGRGEEYNSMGENDRAIQDFNEAIRLDPLISRALASPAGSPREAGDAAAGHYRVGSAGIPEPVCARCPAPPYTEEARHAHFEGTVLLKITILPNGSTTDVKVVRAVGMGLDESAVRTVRNWRFKPVIGPGGRPVKVDLTLQINFRLLDQ